MEVDMEVDITNYKSHGISVAPVEAVSEDEVEKQVEEYRVRLAKEEIKENPGETGDIVLGEYIRIEIDGKESQLDENKNFRIEIGADEIQEFNQAFIGAKAGEEKTINVIYPQDYQIKELAGKAGSYRIKVLEIKTRQFPELNDDFAKRLGAENLDSFKVQVKKNLEESRAASAKSGAHMQIMQKIMEAHPFDVPKAKIKHYVETRLKQQGKADNQISEEDKARLEEEAVLVIKRHRIVEQIARKEKIKATQEEVDERIKKLAAQYQSDWEVLKTQLRKNGAINNVREEIKELKTLDFLLTQVN
jgi:trigger factor